LEYFKVAWNKGYHMVHCWMEVNNFPKWRLGYVSYKNSIKNGNVLVATIMMLTRKPWVMVSLPSLPKCPRPLSPISSAMLHIV
jgi:hypothetical protein